MKASIIAALLLCVLGMLSKDAHGFGSVATTATAKHPILALRPYYMFVGGNGTPLNAIGPDDPAQVGEAVVAWRDVSGVTVRDAVQATAADQPLLTAGGGVNFADTSDHVEISSFGAAGTMVVGTSLGTAVYEVNSTAFTDISALGRRSYSGNPAGVLYFIGMFPPLTAHDKAIVRSYCEIRGAESDFGANTSFLYFWRGRTDIISFPTLDTSSALSVSTAWYACSGLTEFPELDVGSVTTFTSAWQNCSGLTSFPALNFSSGLIFNLTWSGCSNLASFPSNVFDSCAASDFTNAFVTCALNQTSVDNILVSIDTAGQINGTLNMTGGTSSAPSAVGLAAKASLEGKGWTVTVNP